MIADTMVVFKTVFNENSAGYEYQVNGFTKILYFYREIELIFEASLPWYHVTVEKRSLFYLYKNQKVQHYPDETL